jgi:hypothetical protein
VDVAVGVSIDEMGAPMNQERTAPASKRYLALYFALTIPLAWLFWVPMGFVNRHVWPLPESLPVPIIVFVMSTLGAVSPLVALGILQRVSGGQITLAAIFQNIRLQEWRRGWTLASPLVMIGIHVVLVLAYFGVAAVRGADAGPVQIFKPDVFSTLGWWILLVIPLHFFPALITSPLFEEPGWRGFAFENLQHYVPRDVAGLGIGSYWWLWHQGMNVAFGLEPSLYGYASMLLDSIAIDGSTRSAAATCWPRCWLIRRWARCSCSCMRRPRCGMCCWSNWRPWRSCGIKLSGNSRRVEVYELCRR